MTRWIGLCAALLTACGAPPDRYVVTVDESVDAAQAELVSSAAQEWVDRAPGLELRVERGGCDPNGNGSPDGNHVCVVVADRDPATDTHIGVAPKPAWEAPGHDGGVIIYLAPLAELFPDCPLAFRTAALHEFGHAWGLDHTEPGTAMAPEMHDMPDYCDGGRVTDDDVVQYLSVHQRG